MSIKGTYHNQKNKLYLYIGYISLKIFMYKVFEVLFIFAFIILPQKPLLYNNFFLNIFNQQSIDLSILYLKNDKLLITDIGNEHKLYNMLINKHIRKDDILYFTL